MKKFVWIIALDKTGLSRFAREAAYVAAFAVVLLALGHVSGNAAASDRVMEIDCNNERELNVKLGPREPRVLIHTKNCRCWDSSAKAKGYVDWFIRSIQRGEDLPAPTSEEYFHSPTRAQSYVTISGVETTVLFCYPESSFRRLEDWRVEMLRLYRQ